MAEKKPAAQPPKAPAKKAEYDADGNEKPPVYRLDRGESLPSEPEKK